MGCCEPGSGCYRFWTNKYVVIGLVVLNFIGFFGWIAGAIYVTAVGNTSQMWMWAMPWTHAFNFYILPLQKVEGKQRKLLLRPSLNKIMTQVPKKL